MLHKIFRAHDSASLVHLGFGFPVLIHIVGFAIMVSKPGYSIGSILVPASDLAFYLISGIAVNSIFLNPTTRSPKSLVFMSVFTLAAISVVVSGWVTMTKDGSFFHMVSPLEIYWQPLTQEGHGAGGKLCVPCHESAGTYFAPFKLRKKHGNVNQSPINNRDSRKSTVGFLCVSKATLISPQPGVFAIVLLQYPTV
jgi:hypothetical protein